MVMPQWKTKGAHHVFSQGDIKITGHEIEVFLRKLLLDPPLPAVMDLDHVSLRDMAKIKAIHMHRAVDQLHTGKHLIHGQLRITQVIGKAVFFLFNRLHFVTSSCPVSHLHTLTAVPSGAASMRNRFRG